MKVVLLAGGLGSRLAEETDVRPKPLVEIGGRPILWHIMKTYAAAGHTEFVVALGYRGYMIKEYFANYYLHSSDVTIDLSRNEVQTHESAAEPWRVTLVDTGDETMTGGRLLRLRRYVGDETFCMTYGDGLADLDVAKTIAFHRAHGKPATLTAVQPPGRFGALELRGDEVAAFREKPHGDNAWINGGYFVLEPEVLDLIEDDSTVWENEPLESLAQSGHLAAYRHEGFWQPLDTLRDKRALEALWQSGNAPWKRA
ncbi:MAG: glucose-1-phosphate cytidylyltransferase [Candidatus Tyrphobacter sp.]